MKKQLQISIVVLMAIFYTAVNAFAQNPSVGTVPDDSLVVGSGGGYVFIPDIDDGDGMTQSISFTITSTDDNICEPGTVDYTTGDKVAVLNLIEKGTIGTVTITVEVDDGDGTDQSTFTLHVGPYNKPGINFELHDIIFWQESNPVGGVPPWKTIVSSGEAPWSWLASGSNWDLVLPLLTVDDQCTAGVCTGQDFFTAFFRGYVVPPTTGSYSFIIKGSNMDKALWLSTDDDFDNAVPICYDGDNMTVGSESGDEVTSSFVTLQAGQAYAIYATQWIIHTKDGGIQWTGPGISQEYIPGENLMYVYDPVVPTSPSNLTFSSTGSTLLRVTWDAGTDDKGVKGYNIYVDGIKDNTNPVDDTEYKIESLSPNTTYSVVVTTVDGMGNESDPSNIITTDTWPTDGTDPNPPTTINTITNTGTALEIAWSGATDGETEVIGYDVYVDGVLYNTDDHIYTTSTIIKVLDPRTSYDITIRSFDAALNESVSSSTHTETTASFDAYGDDLGVKRAVVNVEAENITFSAGIGINPSWVNGTAIYDATQYALMEDLDVGAIRWGAIDANSASHSLSNHVGTSPTLTYGDWINAAIDLDAYAVICCAVEDGSDYRNSASTFVNFIEYVNGPAGTTYGDMRIAEGYTEPMLQNVKGLVFEFGNEVWGADAHDAQIGANYDTYVAWCRTAANMMRNSPYYDEDKISLVYSGRGPRTSDSQNQKCITGDDGLVDWIGVSGYLGGNLSYDPEIAVGESELDYYKNGIQMMADNIVGMQGLLKLSLTERGETMPMYFYEGTTSTPAYNARVGQGILTLDYFAKSVETGHAVPSIFHLTGGQWRITDPGNGYEPYCLYYATKFYNKVAKDRNVLKTTVQSPNVLTNSSGIEVNLDPVGAYAYTHNGDYSVILISRDYAEDYYVQVDLPDDVTFGGTATMYSISGAHYSDFATIVDSSTITLTDSILVRVPKHTMIALSFTGDDQNFTPMKPGEYTYTKQTSVTIEPVGGSTTLSQDMGVLVMNANTQPSNTFITAVNWEVTDNPINVLHAAAGEGYLIQGTGICAGNGTVTIRASLIDDPSIYDEITITVTGQGGCGVVPGIKNPNVAFSVYPNPAQDILNVSLPVNERGLVTISNIHGSRLSQTEITGSGELNIQNLSSGIYLIQVNTTSGKYTHKFIKE